MKFALMVMFLAHGISGGVHTQRYGVFDDYQSCADAGVSQVETLRPIYADKEIRWECQPIGEQDDDQN